MNILYEDEQIIVVEKPVGMESQAARALEPDMVSEVKKHWGGLSSKREEPYVGVIHRLDKPVSGILVYARTKAAAGALSKQVSGNQMEKRYLAVVCGKPVDNSGKYVDYLRKDGKRNVSEIVNGETTHGKRAELSYQVLGGLDTGAGPLSLLEIRLQTGRHHQIRVQLAGRQTPILGDLKYDCQKRTFPGQRCLALCAWKLSFLHPKDGKRMEFTVKPLGAAFDLFAQHITIDPISC